MRLSYGFFVLLVRVVSRLFFGLTIKGAQYIPSQGKLLIAANHQSYFDPPLVGSCLSREIYYMAKAELFRKPIFGALIRHLNSIPVNRSGQDFESVRRAVHVLESDHALLVFPEGTRSRDGRFLKPTGGLGLLAKQSGAPVIPAYIHGTRGCWKSPFGRNRIKVVFGAPLQFSSISVEHLQGNKGYQAFSDFVMQEIATLKAANAGT